MICHLYDSLLLDIMGAPLGLVKKENLPAIRECPERTIGSKQKSFHGIYKWYIDPEKCLDFWARNNGSCDNRIRVCSFNKLPGRLHDLVRYLVRNAPWLDPLLAVK